jgi:hypothetical protein
MFSPQAIDQSMTDDLLKNNYAIAFKALSHIEMNDYDVKS